MYSMAPDPRPLEEHVSPPTIHDAEPQTPPTGHLFIQEWIGRAFLVVAEHLLSKTYYEPPF